MRKTAIVIIVLFALWSPLFSQSVRTGQYTYTEELFIDSGKKILPEQILSSPKKFSFVPITDANRKIGYSPSALWLKLAIVKESACLENVYVEFAHPWTSLIDVYVRGGGGDADYHTGSMRLFQSRPVDYRGFVFPVHLNPGTTYIYARLESPNRTLNLSVHLMSAADFDKNEKLELIALFLYYGILVAMALYNLFIFFSIRDRSYLYLMLFIAFLFMYNLVFDGVAYQYLWPRSPSWGNMSLNVFFHLFNMFFLLFVRSFLRTREHIPGIDRLMIALTAVFALYAVLFAIFPGIFPEFVSVTFTFVLIILVIVIGIILLKRGLRSARFFALACAFPAVGGILAVSRAFGILGANIFTMYGFQIGSIFMLLLLSLGLADRINFMMKENKRAEEKIAHQYMEIQAQYEELESMNEELTQTNSELMNTYDALSREKELLSATLLSIGDGVIVTDGGGRVVLMNRAAESMTGVPHGFEGELDGILDLNDEILGTPIPPSSLLFAREGPFNGKTVSCLLATRNAGERNVLISSFPVRIKEGDRAGTVLAVRDVTDRRRMEKKIIMSDKMESLTVLAGTIAHDINNMLTILGGAVSLARISLPDNPENAVEQLNVGEAAIEKAGSITRQLINFSRGDMLQKKPGNIGKAVADAAMMALGGTGVDLSITLDEEMPPVEFDEVHISQVIHNLLLNSVQAMPHGGRITVSIKNVHLTADNPSALPPGKYVLISIEDSGIGIPRDQIGKIFDPYFSTKEKGMGLGLASCYIIVKRHGGSIQVESEAGRGTRFDVYISYSGR